MYLSQSIASQGQSNFIFSKLLVAVLITRVLDAKDIFSALTFD